MDIANVMILVGRMAGHTQNDDYPLTLVIIMLLIGLGLLSVGILAAVKTRQRLARMVRAQGKVVERASYEDREGDLHFTLTIEFRAANGEVVCFESGADEKRRIGDTVTRLACGTIRRRRREQRLKAIHGLMCSV